MGVKVKVTRLGAIHIFDDYFGAESLTQVSQKFVKGSLKGERFWDVAPHIPTRLPLQAFLAVH